MTGFRRRTLGRKDVMSILRRGFRTEQGALRLYWRPVPGNLSNAFSLSIKTGALKRAVDRNRWKRVVRESVRSSGYLGAKGFEAVFMLIRPPSAELSLREWKPVVTDLLRAAGAC